jgi:hypothetical protein
MILRFSPALDAESVFGHGRELNSILGRDIDVAGRRRAPWPESVEEHVVDFPDPVLVTDNARIGQLPPTLRETVFALFRSPVVRVEYDGSGLAFEQRKYPGVWGPSIDTLLFCKALRTLDLSAYRTAAEAGSGSGFLSKYLLARAPALESLTLIDLDERAISCARAHLQDPRARFIVGDAVERLRGARYDLIACNPPYIPRPAGRADNAYEGLRLLASLISDARETLTAGGVLITNLSSLSEKTARRLCEDASCDVRDLMSLRVPLKVFNVLNNPRWMDYLRTHAGLEKEPHDGYEYWHTITIVAVRPRRA